MKAFVTTFLFLCSTALAGTIIDGQFIRGQMDGQQNYVKNPICEKNGLNTTATAITVASDKSAGNTAHGISSCLLTTTNATNIVYFDVNAIDPDVTGNCEFKASFKGDGTTWTFGLDDGAGNVKTIVALTNESGFRKIGPINYPCASGYRPFLKSSATSKTLNVADVGYTKATNIGSVNNVGPWTSYTPTITSFGTTSAVNFSYSQSGPNAIIRFVFTMGTGTATTASFSLPAGLYIDSSVPNNSLLGKVSASAAPYSGGLAAFSVNSSNIYFTNDAGAYSSGMNGNAWAAGTTLSGTVIVPIQGWAAQQAVRVDQTPANWSGYQTVSSGWTQTSTTYADPTAGSSIATTMTTARNITCSTASGSLPGLSCNLPRAGFFRVCAIVDAVNSTTNNPSARLVDGSGTIIDPGRSLTEPVATGLLQFPLCGSYNATSVSSAVTFKVQTATTAGTMTIVNGSPAGSSAIAWTIEQLDSGSGAPLLVGSVTTKSNGAFGIEASKIAHSGAGTCSIAAAGTGLVSSIAACGTAGAVALTFATGYFASIPYCWCNANSAITPIKCGVNSVTASGATAYLNNSASGGALAAADFEIFCMGAR